MTPRIFVDTNVWFSAFYGSENSERIVKDHINGKIKAVISQKVLFELVENISKKIPQALPGLQKLLESAPPEIVMSPSEVPQVIVPLAEKKDRIILAAAFKSEVGVFVTGNIKDFNVVKIKELLGIIILTPKQFVTGLGQ